MKVGTHTLLYVHTYKYHVHLCASVLVHVYTLHSPTHIATNMCLMAMCLPLSVRGLQTYMYLFVCVNSDICVHVPVCLYVDLCVFLCMYYVHLCNCVDVYILRCILHPYPGTCVCICIEWSVVWGKHSICAVLGSVNIQTSVRGLTPV